MVSGLIDAVQISLNEKEPGNRKRAATQSKTGTRVLSPRNAEKTAHVRVALVKITESFSSNGSRYSMIYVNLFKSLQETLEYGSEYLIR